MVELNARVAIESLLRATDNDATPIIRRLARNQARAFLATQLAASQEGEGGATRLKYYPDYIDDPDGLERFRQAVLSNDGHDIAAVNHNSLGRLIDTIERLRRERDAALATPATSA